jgi:hypothetical protein
MDEKQQQKTRVIRVGGQCFFLNDAILSASPLLTRCCHATLTDDLMVTRDPDGICALDRDALLFQHVVLPVLRHGYYTRTDVDPFLALAELSYFGLATPSPGGLGVAEATVVCRLAIDRLLRTMHTRTAASVCFFAEDVDSCPLSPRADLGLCTTLLAALFKSRALVDYGLALDWTLSETEVTASRDGRRFSVVATGEPILACVHFGVPPATERWAPVAEVCLEPISTPLPGLIRARRLTWCAQGVLAVDDMIRVTVACAYDSVHKRLIVSARTTIPTHWRTIASYGLFLSLDAQPILKRMVRLSEYVTEALRSPDPPAPNAIITATIVASPTCRETFVAQDVARSHIGGGDTRLVAPTKTRRICRLTAVLLSA